MPLSPPASPTIGQTYTANGRTWSWTGGAWELVSASGGGGSGATGPTGATGVTGPVGATGPAGGGVGSSWEIPTFTSSTFTAVNGGKYYTRSNDAAVSGGFDILDPATGAANDYYFFWNTGNDPSPYRVGGVAVPAGHIVSRIFIAGLPPGSSPGVTRTISKGDATIVSSTAGLTATAITNIVSLSAAAYAAITSPSATTLYVVTE